jgi:hypothetical protein
MTDTDIVKEYFNLAEQGAPFDDPRLALMRERMTDADAMEVMARLRRSAEAVSKEAAALEAFGRAKFGAEVIPLRPGPRRN